MSLLRITIFLLVGAAMQTLLPTVAVAGSMELPLLTGLLIYIALHSSHGRTVYAALLAGCLYDAFSPAPFGSALPYFLTVGIGMGALRNIVFVDQLITYAVTGIAAVAFKVVYFSVVYSAAGLRPVSAGLFTARLTFGLLFGLFFIPAAFLALCFVRHLIPEPRRRWQ